MTDWALKNKNKIKLKNPNLVPINSSFRYSNSNSKFQKILHIYIYSPASRSFQTYINDWRIMQQRIGGVSSVVARGSLSKLPG